MSEPAQQHYYIVGAGYAGVRTALDLGDKMRDDADVQVTLIDRNPYHQFRTELHKAAAGTSHHEVYIPVERILQSTHDVGFEQGELGRIDVAGKALEMKDGRRLGFDKLVVALGGEPATFNIPGLEHALTISSVNSARVIRDHIEAALAEAANTQDEEARRRLLTVVVGGGGLTGIEFVFELADRLPELCQDAGLPKDATHLMIIEASKEILDGFDPPQVEKARQRLEQKHIDTRLGIKITKVDHESVYLENGEQIAAGSFIWTGGIKGNHLVSQALTSNKRGRAKVNEYLQSVDCPDIYVGGDSAAAINAETGDPVGPTAQNAIQQGGLIAYNLWAERAGKPLKRYEPKKLGMVASLGEGYGIARLAGLDISGLPAAWLKELVTLHYLYSLGGPKLVVQQLVNV